MFKKIETLTGIVASVFLFLLMVVTFVDVIGRNIFNHPLSGASELTEILLAGVVFLMLPSVAFREDHIVIDLIDAVQGKFLMFLEKLLVAIFAGGMFLLIAWRLWILADMSAGYRDATPSLGIPLAPFLYLMAVMAGITGLAFIALLLRWDRRAGMSELERVLKAEGLDVPPADEATSKNAGDK